MSPQSSQPRPRVRHLFKTVDAMGSGGNVVLNFTGRPKQELALIGDTYHRAARTLVGQFGAGGAYSDLAAYPIVFLYRHALELLIKAILTLGNDLAGLLDNEAIKTANPYQDHSLEKHLGRIKSIFEAADWGNAFETAGMSTGQFETIIHEFEEFDGTSFAFRYPVKKDGSASISETHFTFSPKQFAGTLDPILDILSGACTGLEEYRQILCEAKAEMESQAFEDYVADHYEDHSDMCSDYYSEYYDPEH